MYTNFYLTDKVFKPNNYSIFNGWHEYNHLKLETLRDFTEEELLQISIYDKNKAYCHNHHINWSDKSVDAFNQNDWFTFTFIRKPENLICSLYFWGNKMINQADFNPFVNVELEKLTLDQIINICIERDDLRRLWVLPSYIEKLNYVEEFSNDSFTVFLKKYFNLNHEIRPVRNKSENKGFKNHLEEGLIKKNTLNRLVNDLDFVKYKKYLKCTI